MKAGQLAKRAQVGFEGERVRLLTLTIPPRENVGDGLEQINAGFNRLMTRIRRNYPRIKYLKVLEFQKRTKSPHFHLLVNRYIPQRWLADAAGECGLGRICDIREVPSGVARQYVLKYLRKGFDDEDALEALLERKGRRFSFSRGFRPLENLVRWWMVDSGYRKSPDFGAALWRLDFFTAVTQQSPEVARAGPWCIDFKLPPAASPPWIAAPSGAS